MKELPWLALEQELRQESPVEWFKRLIPLSGTLFNQHRDLIQRFGTPNELLDLFRLSQLNPSIHTSGFARWEELAKSYAPSISRTVYSYSRLCCPAEDHEVLFYDLQSQSAEDPPPPRHLVIGLTGNFGLLMAPIPCILAALGRMRCNLLLVRRNTLQGYFSNGAKLLHNIEKHLASLQVLPYRYNDMIRIIVIGTSQGALPALTLALRIGAWKGVGIGAECRRYRRKVDQLNQLLNMDQEAIRFSLPKANEVTPRLILAHPGNNLRDTSVAHALYHYFSRKQAGRCTVRVHGFDGCSDHTLFMDLVRTGISMEDALNALMFYS